MHHTQNQEKTKRQNLYEKLEHLIWKYKKQIPYANSIKLKRKRFQPNDVKVFKTIKEIKIKDNL